MENLFSINHMGRLCNVSRSTLMRFENEGLITPAYKDSHSGYRYYDHKNIAQVLYIIKFQKLGFSKKEIKELFRSPDIAKTQLQKMKEHYMELLTETTNLLSTPKDVTVQIKKAGSCHAYHTVKEINYSKEGLHQFATYALNQFTKLKIDANEYEYMQIYPTEPLKSFDGKIHECHAIIPMNPSVLDDDYEILKETTFLSLTCQCTHKDAHLLFDKLYGEAALKGFTPTGSVRVAGLADIFLCGKPIFQGDILRLFLPVS
ncbi:MAG: MerR family transcriptional regulator [Lachnospiraceae bacterium]|nr:MerR family transcriptional regulator [Lachnospiraceae bacterium]